MAEFPTANIYKDDLNNNNHCFLDNYHTFINCLRKILVDIKYK